MHDHAVLLSIGIALAAGLAGGLLARALRLPPLIGFLLAGIAVGPHTPGILADESAVQPVANLGVMLLMFAVGIQFSLEELRAVQKTALVAGGVQVTGTILIGLALGLAFGWGAYGGVFFGCALALSSTAVVMRILEERGELGSGHGSIILGIAVIQDLSLILMAALLPALAQFEQGGGQALAAVGIALLKAIAFIAMAILLAARGVPRLLDLVSRTGSRELFLVMAVVICLAAAVSAEVAGLGLPLGAFLAGIVISESDYAHDVIAQIRPLRDVFAVLFFVSVGMLLDPGFLVARWPTILAVVLAIVIGKSLVTAIPVYAMGWHGRVALLSGLGLAQIGEFSFVLAMLGSTRGLIGGDIANVILTSALISLMVTPFLFQASEPLYRALNQVPAFSRILNRQAQGTLRPRSQPHPNPRVLVLGYGRIGRYVSDALRAKEVAHLVVEFDGQSAARCRRNGVPVLFGDATSPTVLEAAHPQTAELAVVALPEAGMTEITVRELKAMAPNLQVVARVHRGIYIPRIRAAGADAVIHAEFEAGTEMIRQGLDRLGFGDREVDNYIEEVRQHRYRSTTT